MPQPPKSFWCFLHHSVAESLPFLSLLLGAVALIPVLICWLEPSSSAGGTVLRLLVYWTALGIILFGLVILLVGEDYRESKSRRQPSPQARLVPGIRRIQAEAGGISEN